MIFADTTLTLARQGTTTVTTMEDARPEPISMDYERLAQRAKERAAGRWPQSQ